MLWQLHGREYAYGYNDNEDVVPPPGLVVVPPPQTLMPISEDHEGVR